MKKLIVNEKYDEKNLNRFIFDSFPSLKQNQFYKALRKKDIRINGIRTSENKLLHKGDEVTIYITDEVLENSSTFQIPIIYEDNNILVANKPENLSVTEDSISSTTLSSILKKQYPFLEPCHRIDRNTKGLVLFAKNKESLSILLEAFKNKDIEKHYLAKILGVPKQKHAVLNSYLFKDSKKSIVYISDVPKKDFAPITTEYLVLSSNINENFSICDITLHTGKTHQIRAHFAHIGHPLIGDGKYGNNEINKKFHKKTQELYAYKLIFHFSNSSKLSYLNKKEITLPFPF